MLYLKQVSFKRATEQELETKGNLVSKPILQYPDFTNDLILTTDASNEGLGAILSRGETRKDLPTA
jgi:hypothetical protein